MKLSSIPVVILPLVDVSTDPLDLMVTGLALRMKQLARTSPKFIELVEKAIQLSKENKSDIDAIRELGEGWVAEETFAIAIYSCLKYKNSFEDAVICSVNHDGDSDSTGAVTGNIMGVYLGYDAIPDYYIDHLELKDVIYEIANDLATEVPVDGYGSNTDDYWENKYVYAVRKDD